jgi:DNA topoisomerase-1
MIIKEGRFGAYVTDGEVNATLRRGDDVETITAERAAELLAEKRAKGPTPKKRPAKRSQAAGAEAAAPKPAAKRVAAKKIRTKAG